MKYYLPPPNFVKCITYIVLNALVFTNPDYVKSQSGWSGTNPLLTTSDVKIGPNTLGTFINAKTHIFQDDGWLLTPIVSTSDLVIDESCNHSRLLSLSKNLYVPSASGNPMLPPSSSLSSVPTWNIDINSESSVLDFSYTNWFGYPQQITQFNPFTLRNETKYYCPTETKVFEMNTDYVSSLVPFRINTSYGTSTIGALNAHYFHFNTDRTKFYFNKRIVVDEGIVSSYDEDLKLQTSGTDRIIIKNDGSEISLITDRIKIGGKTATYHPDAKVHIEGKIAAQHFVITKPTNWSDKVFQKGYNLMTLLEIEEYISENKHLPEVPSEAEIMERGYDANEMDALLLQKIEELTLHLIELKKENEFLKTEILTLKMKSNE